MASTDTKAIDASDSRVDEPPTLSPTSSPSHTRRSSTSKHGSLSNANHGPQGTELLTAEALAKATDYYVRLNRLLDDIEKKSGRARRRSSERYRVRSRSDSDATSVTSSVRSTGVNLPPPAPPVPQLKKSLPLILSVATCDWEHFVNSFSPDEPPHIIEALIAGHDWEKQVETEHEKRDPLLRRDRRNRSNRSKQVRRVYADTKWVRRVRIRSPRLLRIFSKATGHAWGSQPHTFARPFQYLVYSHDKFKRELERLELVALQKPKRKDEEDATATTSQDAAGDSNAAGTGDDTGGRDAEDPVRDMEELRCYIEFAEKSLLPDAQLYHMSDQTRRPKIKFTDLWYLFKPGDLIYVPWKTLSRAIKPTINDMRVNLELAADTKHASRLTQHVWRVQLMIMPAAEDSASRYPWLDDDRMVIFQVLAYYIDLDGSLYGATNWKFPIEEFQGEKDIVDLEFYPLKFHPDADRIIANGKKSGRMYTKAVFERHRYYDGWSAVTDPKGLPILESEDFVARRQKRPEHIQGQVIVDFQEAYNSMPMLKSGFVDAEAVSVGRSVSSTSLSETSFIVWSDANRTRRILEMGDELVGHVESDAQEHDDYLRTDPYLKAATRLRTIRPDVEDDLVLLPVRVFVYALRQRRFVPVDVCRLRPVAILSNAIDQLQLPKHQKDTIQAAVFSHLRRQRIERVIEENRETELKAQDFIAGKGRGLLIMLHGEPGVGKTATAEAIAQATQRPLFPVNCSDLESRPSRFGTTVEDLLDEIFRLAHLWDCVLLMDEADVFLSARNTYGQSNTFVSIFLRKLEYYNGILFLTTNRIGKLDPAMSSRIHLIFHYKRLGATEVETIFRTNIQRLRESEQQQHEVSGEPPLIVLEHDILKFAADHCAKHPKSKGAWNGRQIRNAFIVASSLARHEAVSSGMTSMEFRPQLRYIHFEKVEKLIEDYNKFRAHVLGGDDSRKARLNEERDDDYQDEEDAQDRAQERASETSSNHKLVELLRSMQQSETPSTQQYMFPNAQSNNMFQPGPSHYQPVYTGAPGQMQNHMFMGHQHQQHQQPPQQHQPQRQQSFPNFSGPEYMNGMDNNPLTGFAPMQNGQQTQNGIWISRERQDQTLSGSPAPQDASAEGSAKNTNSQV